MPLVRVIKNHVANGRIRRVGEEYEATELQASDRVRVRLVEVVDETSGIPRGVVAKVEYGMYAPREFSVGPVDLVGDETDEVVFPHLIRRSGNWWIFSDDTKVLGRAAAAEKLGVTLEVFEVEHEPRFS